MQINTSVQLTFMMFSKYFLLVFVLAFAETPIQQLAEVHAGS